MKGIAKALLMVAALACVASVSVVRAGPAEGKTPARAMLENILAAVEANDYDAFLKDATAEVKAGLTPKMLEGVNAQMAPHMKKGYEVTYLGSLRQQGSEVELWKLTFEDGSDDVLAKLVVKDGKAAGFWLQ